MYYAVYKGRTGAGGTNAVRGFVWAGLWLAMLSDAATFVTRLLDVSGIGDLALVSDHDPKRNFS